MNNIVDLGEWRRSRGLATQGAPLARLERAVERLPAAVEDASRRNRPAPPSVETEVLAIIGAISSDLLEEAAGRAERLLERLSPPAVTPASDGSRSGG